MEKMGSIGLGKLAIGISGNENGLDRGNVPVAPAISQGVYDRPQPRELTDLGMDANGGKRAIEKKWSIKIPGFSSFFWFGA
ncbi:hypothetical protein AAWM_05509 [Aspergillus awamori]|uniref:Uncharacterized protein n=1 Tax=Aspergillus awamori TaxID=105351 RepID=A0A401KTJ5_ASPAW|nr:hypothetical protein AAWM_05509 [Aspergillus awamori]